MSVWTFGNYYNRDQRFVVSSYDGVILFWKTHQEIKWTLKNVKYWASSNEYLLGTVYVQEDNPPKFYPLHPGNFHWDGPLTHMFYVSMEMPVRPTGRYFWYLKPTRPLSIFRTSFFLFGTQAGGHLIGHNLHLYDLYINIDWIQGRIMVGRVQVFNGWTDNGVDSIKCDNSESMNFRLQNSWNNSAKGKSRCSGN